MNELIKGNRYIGRKISTRVGGRWGGGGYGASRKIHNVNQCGSCVRNPHIPHPASPANCGSVLMHKGRERMRRQENRMKQNHFSYNRDLSAAEAWRVNPIRLGLFSLRCRREGCKGEGSKDSSCPQGSQPWGLLACPQLLPAGAMVLHMHRGKRRINPSLAAQPDASHRPWCHPAYLFPFPVQII